MSTSECVQQVITVGSVSWLNLSTLSYENLLAGPGFGPGVAALLYPRGAERQGYPGPLSRQNGRRGKGGRCSADHHAARTAACHGEIGAPRSGALLRQLLGI